MLDENQARELVKEYISNEEAPVTTQEILDSGAVPRLQGYIVKPGKVSDCVYGGDVPVKEDGRTIDIAHNGPLQTSEGLPLYFMVRTDRISTHDINRGSIPFKDQILAANHAYMQRMLGDTLGSSQFDVGLSDTAVVIGAEKLKQIKVENVLRAYMAKSSTSTSLYQHFINGDREFCGHQLPGDLITNGKLPYVMDTPSTKSDTHDESVPPEFLFEHRVVTPEQYGQIRNASLVAFGRVSQLLSRKGLILVDTKTEHGINHNGEIVAQDELYTMDSSRFWLADDYAEQVKKLDRGEIEELSPRSFSKEFARGFSKGKEGYTDEQREDIAVRYIMGIQRLLGREFHPDMRPRSERVISGLEEVVKLVA